ncbi:hypothetical protein QN239_25665 [Mycolicibacterium sp. Y3]
MMTEEYARPNWLFVARFDDPATGRTWRAVYASTWLDDGDPLYEPAQALIDGGAELRRELILDDYMIGQGELRLFAA